MHYQVGQTHGAPSTNKPWRIVVFTTRKLDGVQIFGVNQMSSRKVCVMLHVAMQGTAEGPASVKTAPRVAV